MKRRTVNSTWSALATAADKPRSRAKPGRDWTKLHDVVTGDAGAFGLDWDEHYVPAMQRALEGRDPRALLQLLDEGRLVHPNLLPVLADILRAKDKGKPGRARALTMIGDANIRHLFDALTGCGHEPAAARATLVDMFNVSEETIARSLKRTKPAAK